jgi:hypothetical protein
MQCASALRTLLIAVPVALLLAASPVAAQQTYVSQFDAYAGYAFLDSPHISLFEDGFQMQVGYRPRPWYSLGFDYSLSAGDLVLTPNLLPTALQQQLSAELGQMAAAGLVPPGYALAVSTHSRSQTFAAGPQFSYRHFSHLTLFIRPSLGAIHEVATPRPADPIATAVAEQLAPAGKKTDTTGFYGFGGGVDVLLSQHFGLRTQADLVYDHLFNDLLKDGRLTVRFSIGPCFNFGKNIVK